MNLMSQFVDSSSVDKVLWEHLVKQPLELTLNSCQRFHSQILMSISSEKKKKKQNNLTKCHL